MKKRDKRTIKLPRFKPGKLFRERFRRERAGTAMDYQPTDSVPRITNETVAEHREEVLSTARKYIYPLQQSKHKIVVVSAALFLVLLLIFFTYILLALYRFESTSTFTYRVTQVIPFPVAKTSAGYVTYENYLFELRHYLHYYETQQKVDFSTKSGKDQLENFRQRSLEQVTRRAYVKQLAKEKGVTVSDADVNRTINILKDQQRLGSSNQVFQDVLKEYWDWSVDDFKRELRTEILEQKLTAALDTDATTKAQNAVTAARSGTDFTELVKQFSDDPVSKQQGGDYGLTIKRNTRDVPPQIIDALFRLKAGEVSDIINTGTTLEISKVVENKDGQIKAQRISIFLKPLSSHIDAAIKRNPPSYYIDYKKE